jgi:hypothetical protein
MPVLSPARGSAEGSVQVRTVAVRTVAGGRVAVAGAVDRIIADR